MIAIIFGMYLGLSLLTFAAYVIDKRAARFRRRRIPEMTLLVLGVAGGWPGGLLAQQVLRHKTKKVGFQVQFWLSVLVNVGLAIWFVRMREN